MRNFTSHLKGLYEIKKVNLFIYCLLIIYFMLINNCLGNGIFGPSLTKCEAILDLIVVDIDASNQYAPTQEQVFQTNAMIAYYASHCDGTESKKHKRKKNDPIYNLSGKKDEY